MKKRKFLSSYSLTEKVLISIALVLMTTLLLKLPLGSKLNLSQVFAQETSESSEESTDDEKSEDDDSDSVDEMSVDDPDEMSEDDDSDSVDEMSVDDPDEMSVEDSEESFGIFTGSASGTIFDEDDYEEVIEFDGGQKLVRRQERLFFLIPVDIESTITVDDNGEIVAVDQSFWSRILSFFSF